MRKMLALLFGFATATSLASIVCAATPATTPTSRNMVLIDDIAYREGASKSWRLDLAMLEPTADEPRPAIVIIHGGGWRAGSKRDRVFRDMLLHYALKGYLTISVEYRLTQEAPFPACIEDVKCAVRWLRAHAQEYHVDPNRIGSYGHSAGAHLSLMLAMSPKSAGLEGDGPYQEYSSVVTCAAGGSPPTKVPQRMAAGEQNGAWSPTGYVHSGLPPLLLIQGVSDNLVPVAQTDAFVESVKNAGSNDITYLRIDEPGAHHGVAYEQFMDRSFNALDRFFDRNLKQPTTRSSTRP